MSLTKLWRRSRPLLPTAGFHFDRPMVLLQSDDWGRVGVRDQEGFDQLRSVGLELGERPYDLYTLETAQDVSDLGAMLKRHRDSGGRHPCLEMNFVVANLDFAKMRADDFRRVHVVALAEGLPPGWNRPGLFEAYREGIAEGVFRPALHGTTHFCQSAVERNANRDGERAQLLRNLWQAGTPYIHWRMPWIGYEYWDPENSVEERNLPPEIQRGLIGRSVGAFAKMFSMLPASACAPGYQASEDTHAIWAEHGIRVAQSGPDYVAPPHFYIGDILHLSRTVEFEPGLEDAFSVDECVRRAERCFEQGLPAIVSAHSLNFHSTLRDFRSRTLSCLDEFLTTLESKHADLLYLHDDDVHDLVRSGACETPHGKVQMKVIRKTFVKARVKQHWED